MKNINRIIEQIRYRADSRKDLIRTIFSVRMDTNNSIPFAICKKNGWDLPKNAMPGDAWNEVKRHTGNEPEFYYAELYKKGGSKQKITHFKTKGGEMEVTYDLNLNKKFGTAKKKMGVLLKGEKIRNITSFAGKGSNRVLDKAAVLAQIYPGTKENEWSHKKGFADVVKKNGQISTREIHWIEHDKVGQMGMKIKY